jgi:hypothetical protein
MIRRAVARILLLTFICQHPAAMAAPVPVSGTADVARERESRATRSEPSEHTERATPPPKAAVTEGGDAPTGLLPLSLDLGAARRFNGFFFEGFTAPSSDIQGRLAAGSFVSLNHYSIASEIRPTAVGPSLVVGGELTFPEGRVYVGDIVVGGSALGLGQAVREGLGPNQHVYEFAPLPFDLERERERITGTS